MYAVAWRHNARCPWNIMAEPLPSEQAARDAINKHGKYDMAHREYRIIPLGDADTWSDPHAEQAERLGVELPTVREVKPRARYCDCGGPFVGKPENYHLDTCDMRNGKP